jgi:hypothetical protein
MLAASIVIDYPVVIGSSPSIGSWQYGQELTATVAVDGGSRQVAIEPDAKLLWVNVNYQDDGIYQCDGRDDWLAGSPRSLLLRNTDEIPQVMADCADDPFFDEPRRFDEVGQADL